MSQFKWIKWLNELVRDHANAKEGHDILEMCGNAGEWYVLII